MEHGDGPNTYYASYLLRLKSIAHGDQVTWLASLEDTATGKRRSFPSGEALVAFLLAEFKGHQAGDKSEAPSESPPQSGSTPE